MPPKRKRASHHYQTATCQTFAQKVHHLSNVASQLKKHLYCEHLDIDGTISQFAKELRQMIGAIIKHRTKKNQAFVHRPIIDSDFNKLFDEIATMLHLLIQPPSPVAPFLAAELADLITPFANSLRKKFQAIAHQASAAYLEAERKTLLTLTIPMLHGKKNRLEARHAALIYYRTVSITCPKIKTHTLSLLKDCQVYISGNAANSCFCSAFHIYQKSIALLPSPTDPLEYNTFLVKTLASTNARLEKTTDLKEQLMLIKIMSEILIQLKQHKEDALVASYQTAFSTHLAAICENMAQNIDSANLSLRTHIHDAQPLFNRIRKAIKTLKKQMSGSQSHINAVTYVTNQSILDTAYTAFIKRLIDIIKARYSNPTTSQARRKELVQRALRLLNDDIICTTEWAKTTRLAIIKNTVEDCDADIIGNPKLSTEELNEINEYQLTLLRLTKFSSSSWHHGAESRIQREIAHRITQSSFTEQGPKSDKEIMKFLGPKNELNDNDYLRHELMQLLGHTKDEVRFKWFGGGTTINYTSYGKVISLTLPSSAASIYNILQDISLSTQALITRINETLQTTITKHCPCTRTEKTQLVYGRISQLIGEAQKKLSSTSTSIRTSHSSHTSHHTETDDEDLYS